MPGDPADPPTGDAVEPAFVTGAHRIVPVVESDPDGGGQSLSAAVTQRHPLGDLVGMAVAQVGPVLSRFAVRDERHGEHADGGGVVGTVRRVVARRDERRVVVVEPVVVSLEEHRAGEEVVGHRGSFRAGHLPAGPIRPRGRSIRQASNSMLGGPNGEDSP